MGKRSRSDNSSERPTKEKDNVVEMRGRVIEALPSTLFKVQCEGGHVVLATISGKIRQNRIRVLPEDNVLVEVSPYDPTRGRITWRDKQ